MGLYKPAKQLQMSLTDMNHLTLCPGELHLMMAQLLTISTYIKKQQTRLLLDGSRSIWISNSDPDLRRKIYPNGQWGICGHNAGPLHDATRKFLPSLTRAAGQADSGHWKPLTSLWWWQLPEHLESTRLQVQEMESLKVMEKMTEFDSKEGWKPLFAVMHQ